MKKIKKVLITGGAGFIGSHLCEYFLEREYEVFVMDNLMTGSVKNIEQYFKNPAFHFIKYNVVEYLHLPGKIDAVLHFASPASPVDYLLHPIPTLKVGSLGTHKALGFAKEKKAVFLLASTSEVYGDPLINPQHEKYWGNVNPVGPRGVYDEAKRFAEAMTMAYRRYHRLNTKIVRIFNTYGPRMRKNDGRAIPNFINQSLSGKPITVYGRGAQTRSFCYVTDLVRGIYLLLSSGCDYPVNLGNPAEMTLISLAEKIKKYTGSKSRIIFKELPIDDPKVRCPDISVAKNRLGWKPEVGLDEGLKKTIGWFKQAA